MLSSVVLDHVEFPQPFYLKAKHQSLPSVKMYLQIIIRFYLLTPCNLDSESTCGIQFPLTYSISKSNAINLIAHLSILDVVTLGNSFLGLNMNSNGL